MLADPEHVEPELVGKRDFLDQVAQPLRGIDGLVGGRIGRGLREGVDANFHEGMWAGGWSPRCNRGDAVRRVPRTHWLKAASAR